MKKIETLIDSMTYIVGVVDSDAYELHMGNAKVFNNFIDEC